MLIHNNLLRQNHQKNIFITVSLNLDISVFYIHNSAVNENQGVTNMIELKNISPTGTDIGIVQSARFLHKKNGQYYEEPYAYGLRLILTGNIKEMTVKLPVEIGRQKGGALKEECLQNTVAGVTFSDLKIKTYQFNNHYGYTGTASDFNIIPVKQERK